MSKILASLLFFEFLFFSFASVNAAEMRGDDLLNYFSSTCRSQGEFTRQAINDARSLISIVENIKNDSDCQTVSGGLSQLRNLETKLFQLESKESLTIELEKLTAQESELMSQLSLTTDASLRYGLESAIRSVQIDKATYISEISAREKYYGSDVKDFYSKIITSTNSVFNTIASNHRCLDKNPNILPAVTSFAGAVGGLATTINPALGLMASAATDFVGTVLEGLRSNKYEKIIRKISDHSLALEGYKCVMESLSERWCSIRDAEKFLEFKASVRRQTNAESGLASAARLSDRDIPVILDWLNKVRAGVPASSSADAGRQQEVFNREAGVRSDQARGDGIISQERALYDAAGSDEDKYTILRNIVGRLSGNNCSNSSASYPSGALSDIYNSSFAPYYLLGLLEQPREDGNAISFCNFNPFTQWPGGSYSPSLNDVASRYSDWIVKATQTVNQELTLILQPDALQVLTSAYERTSNTWKYSVVDSLENLTDFLANNQPRDIENQSFIRIYQETLAKLTELKVTIGNGVQGAIYKTPKEALENVFDVAELQYGVIVLQTRLEMIIRVSLKNYLDSLNHSGSNLSAQLLAADSFIDVLSRISGTDNLALISADIKRSRPIAIGNMNAFGEIFGDNINDILKKNSKKLKKESDPMLREITQRNTAEVCLLLSSMPKWPKDIKKEYCVNSQLKEVIYGGPASAYISESYISQNFSERSCGYRDYIRKSKVYQEWGIKL